MSEDALRDKLVESLEVIEDGLTYIDKEAFLPNNLGTKGFIDILAHDALGRYVIIEVKKSKATSREALHEVLKYFEGIKEGKSLKDDEIRVIIISTEWEELLVPYSSFIKRVPCLVDGYQLFLEPSTNLLQTKRIQSLNLNNDRLFSDQHIIRLYTNLDKYHAGLMSHQESFREKGVKDYVLISLEAPEDFINRELAAANYALNEIMEFYSDTELFSDPPARISELPNYRYMIYSAIQVLSEIEYWNIISSDPSRLKEVKEYAEMYESEAKLHLLHEYAIDVILPIPSYDHIDISYPAKFSSILAEQGWKILSLVRSGRLQSNELLSDQAILDELKGSSGVNRQKYTKEFKSFNIVNLDQALKEIKVCLQDNPIWLRGIENSFSEIKSLIAKTNWVGKVHIFNPSNTILSIFQVLTASEGESPLDWIPSYYVLAECDAQTRFYYGSLKRNSNISTFTSTIEKFYGHVNNLLMTLNWGGYEANDHQIAKSYGLEYANYLCVTEDGEQKFFEFDGYQFTKTHPTHPLTDFAEFINQEENFVTTVVQLFQKHWIASSFVVFDKSDTE